MPTYTQDEINAALVANKRVWKFEHRAESGGLASGVISRLLPDVVECTVHCAYLATGPNRTCDVTFGPDTVFDQLREVYRPWAYLKMPPAKFADDYQRADSAITLGPLWTALSGTWGITVGKAYSVTAADNNMAVVPFSGDDMVVSAEVTIAAAGGGGVVGRLVDVNNFYLAEVSPTGQCVLWRRLGGTFTQMGSSGAGVYVAGDRLSLSCIGSTISALVNGVVVHSVTDTNIASGTYVGIRQGGTSAWRWDNFQAVTVGDAWQGWPLGTFRLSASTLRVAGSPSDRPQKLEGYDLLVDYQETKFLDRKVILGADSGVNVTPEGNAKVLSSDITQLGIGGVYANAMSAPPTANYQPTSVEWDPGTSYLTAINELLASINYTQLTITAAGQPVSVPYTAPDETPPLWTYKVDNASVIRPGVDTELDLFNVPNVWLGFVSEPDRPTLRSVAMNTDPASETSVNNRGRQIVKVVDTGTLHLTEQTTATGTLPAATQADLDALVARAKDEDSTVYEQVKFDTGIMPFHGVGDVHALDYGAGLANYREMGWSMELKAGGKMSHEFRRAVSL